MYGPWRTQFLHQHMDRPHTSHFEPKLPKSIHVIFGFKKAKRIHLYLVAALFVIGYIWMPSS